MAAVYTHNIIINSGADYSQEYDLFETGGRVIDLTNYSAKAQLRKHRGSSTSVSFTISFTNRKSGKIKLTIPSWITSRLKPGRYLYDILFTKPNGERDIVLEGNVNVRAGISTGCSFSLPTSAQRLCIAVIDESGNNRLTPAIMQTNWDTFRSTYPNRTFYLLQPTAVGFGVSVNNTNYTILACPDNFLNETIVNISPLI
jgi:hypothetical protein